MKSWAAFGSLQHRICPLQKISSRKKKTADIQSAVLSHVRLAWRRRRPSGMRAGSKMPTVTGRKGNADKARAFPETGCLEEAWGRTHVRSEQRTNYMAAGRRSSRRGRARPDIRWTEPKWSWTGYGEVVRLTQGNPPDLTLKAAIDVRKPIPIRRTRSG